MSLPKGNGGRGRSRTHQALSQHLTGFEDQAPHRGCRSSYRLSSLVCRSHPKALMPLGNQTFFDSCFIDDHSLVTVSSRKAQTVKVFQYFDGEFPSDVELVFVSDYRQ